MVTAAYDSPLGEITLATDERGVCGLWFVGQRHFGCFGAGRSLGAERGPERAAGLGLGGLGDRPAESAFAGEKPVASPFIEKARAWLDAYFKGEEPMGLPPLHLIGSPFQREVWEVLAGIPFGETMTYGAIAEEVSARRAARGVAARTSARAVGGAVAANPISVIVPCHRVLGADRAITGYAGGLERKRALLELEGIAYVERYAPTFRGRRA